MKKLKIDEARFLRDVEELGKIGGGEDSSLGRTRLALGDSDAEARRWFIRQLEEIGAKVLIDKFGNIAGVLPGQNDELVAAGSHLDTVVNAGALDGAYGVLGGLAVLRALAASEIVPQKSVGVINFTNEEGVRFKPDMMGSIALAGLDAPEKILSATDKNGVCVSDELARHGFGGKDSFRPHRYVELHIEQGPVLEESQKQIGIVDGIQGIGWWHAKFVGQACHAGAFPMRLRRDPFSALADFDVRLRECVANIKSAVGTIGFVEIVPNVINVVPGEVNFSVDARCPDENDFHILKESVENLLSEVAKIHKVGVEFEIVADAPAIKFPKEMVDLVEKCALAETNSTLKLASGAGHDAQFMHFVCPTAMIFVPSKNGLSHCPQEHTEPQELILGVNVLAGVIEELAGIN